MYRSVTACDSSSVRAFDSRAKLAKELQDHNDQFETEDD
jgi:hypothetical protein|tara:strand:+ start:414 stop:530 length:117 start_codon:yes stop_codon:yes gene_type:complete